MLIRLALAAAVLVFSARALAQEGPKDGLRRPRHLTAGTAQQLLGQMAPDGKTLYFVSTRNITHEVFAQSAGGTRRLFDESADVTWPRVAPDGKSILYISFRDGVAGQLCVRDLPDGGARRCLGGSLPVLEAEWRDRSRIVAVSRPSIEGGLRVIEVSTTRSSLSARALFDRNISTPAVSPDGQWLVYVPIERAAMRVGPAFAARAGMHLEAVRFDQSGRPMALGVDLPGLTGQPVFSRDGRWLYFVQFFTDSNRDGVVDADDHGVLFRAPMTFTNGPRLGVPEQLTDMAWSCQYPEPTATELVVTCTRDRNLDVYTLPLDGEVPHAWSLDRVSQELEIITQTADEQLLHQHELARTTSVAGRQLVMTSLVRLHLRLDDFVAAEFYATHLARLDDPTTARLARPLLTLVEHRRTLRQRELGHLESGFEEDARARFDRLREERGDSRAAVTLIHIVRSELADTMGDVAHARSELALVVVDDTTPSSVLRFYYERADALYRELDDRSALSAVCRRLSTNQALDLEERLDYARAAVRAMTRGLAFDAADAALARERPTVPGDSELAFAIDLGRAVLAVRDDHPPVAVRDAIVALYARQTRPDRRRSVALDATERAVQVDAESVSEAMAERYFIDTAPGTLERRRAEHLYQRAITDRAYRLAAAGRVAQARMDFDAVAHKTGSLESVAASIDLQVRSGKKPTPSDYDAQAFAKAYLISLELPSLKGKAFDTRAAAARAALQSQPGDVESKLMVHALSGAVLHQQFLRSGDPSVAMRASIADLVALDLAGKDVRTRAMVLDELGVLHAAVGNHQIALSYLKRRDELPYVDDAASLATRMAEARSDLHAGHDADAARIADESLAMTERAPSLAEYRVLALDRAALYNLSAGRFDRALALYDTLIPTLTSRRSLFVARTARASAAVGAGKPGRALEDLAVVEPALHDPSMRAVLKWSHASEEDTITSYGAIISGLRANAHGALHQLDEQGRALLERRARVVQRFMRTNHDELLRPLALVDVGLATNAAARSDATAASGWAGAALAHADEARLRAAGPIAPSQADALWLAAEVAVFLHAQPSFDLGARLDSARSEIAAGHDRHLGRLARWLEVYGVLASPK
jgi:tetratricopeptide (TPR) repeat protein